MSGQFAAAFGNSEFSSLVPTEQMVFVAAHHDEGWQPIDERVEMDVNTGLPYHLTQTPLPYLLETSVGSPKFNEQAHAYSGILSSMHTYGLFNGRYGLSDKIFIDLVPADHKPAMQAMLNDELARQQRLIASLQNDPALVEFVSEDYLFHNYKLLQFFDTLALYFHMVQPSERGESVFLNVPRNVKDDIEITIRPIGDGVYSLSPYPFCDPEMTFHYQGRPLSPQPEGTDLKSILSEIEPFIEQVIIRGQV